MDTISQDELQKILADMLMSRLAADGYADHHISSFNYFVETFIPATIQELLGDLVLTGHGGEKHHLSFYNVCFEQPTICESDNITLPMFPDDAMQRSLSYCLSVIVDISQLVYHPTSGVLLFHKVFEHFKLCALPCMIGSNFCYLTLRYPSLFLCPAERRLCSTGFFVVGGQEKVLISQEFMRTNWPCCIVTNDKLPTVRCELRSLAPDKWRSTSTLVLTMTRTARLGITLQVQIPFLKAPVDIYVLFVALGVSKVEDILLLMPNDNPVHATLLRIQCAAFMSRSRVVATVDDETHPESDSRLAALAIRYIAMLHGKVSMYDTENDEASAEVDDRGERDLTNLDAGVLPPEDDDDENDDGDDEQDVPNTAVREPTTAFKTAERQVAHIIQFEVYPHIGTGDAPGLSQSKAMVLAISMAKTVSTFTRMRNPDNRDNSTNKVSHMSGVLLALLWRQLLRRLINQMALRVGKLTLARAAIHHIIDACEFKQLGHFLRYSLTTGNWGVTKAGCSIVGVSQPYQGRDIVCSISQLRRLNANLNPDAKHSGPRQLDTSHAYVICPCETPEGDSSGLVKQLTMVAVMHMNGSYTDLVTFLVHYARQLPPGVFVLPQLGVRTPGSTLILVNGVLIGSTQSPTDYLKFARTLKLTGRIDSYTSISQDDCGIQITCTAGNLMRPVFYLPGLVAFLEHFPFKDPIWGSYAIWDILLKRGAICFLDKAEDQAQCVHHNILELTHDAPPNALFGTPPTHGILSMAFQYVELHPIALVGYAASLTPFADRDQAPRLIYAACMAKQAVGSRMVTMHERFDPTTYSLCYPQRPIVTTMGDALVGTTERPITQNCVMMIAMGRGSNIEDALIFSEKSLQLGLFRTEVTHTYSDEIKQSAAQTQRFCRPDQCGSEVDGLRASNWSHLDNEDGLPYPGTVLKYGDPIIGKVVNVDSAESNDRGQRTVSDRSILQKHQHDRDAVVESCSLSKTPGNTLVVKVKTVTQRIPRVGDKFASRHSQKGVIGAIWAADDMPFNGRGEQVDGIMSPAAIPSRMTVGHLEESLFGKAAALAGELADATTFVNHDLGAVRRMLVRHGFQASGASQFYDGRTGEKMTGDPMVGIVCYQYLKHFVAEKIHARATGPVDKLTRQPPHGRTRDGGFRLGEMERDALIGHGAAYMLNDRLLHNSDAFKVPICRKCGVFAIPARPHDAKYTFTAVNAYCKGCQTGAHVRVETIPYCMALLVRELQAMHIAPRLYLDRV